MSRQILETRRQVVSAVISAYPGGRECASARLGMPLKKFDNHAYENNGSKPLDDEQLYQLEAHTHTHYLPDYVCGLYGGVFVKLESATDLDNLDLYARSLQTDVAEGRVDQIIAKALADGQLSEAEIAKIIAAHRCHMAARESEVQAVITLHRGGAR